MTTTTRFRVYVACLSAYNSGIMHGKWVDVTGDVDELRADIARILAASPEADAEEWAFHGYDGFNSSQWGENPGLEELCDHVNAMGASDYDEELIEGVCDNLHVKAREAIAYIDDNYQGEYTSLEEWAEDSLQETGSITLSNELKYYFDYERYGRDAEMGGDIFTVEVGSSVHVLYNS